MMGETVIILGGGPAGTASAMNLLKHGFQPIIIESEVFPRFHIGESLTTECVDALNRLGLQQQLEALHAPQKKGVRIFSHHPENSFYVGAGDAWQVERAKFDHMMLTEAIQRGAQHITARVQHIERQDNHTWHVSVQTDTGLQTLDTRFVIDATGQQRLTQKQGLWGDIAEGDYARQIALFGQIEGVERAHKDMHDTLIFHRNHHEWGWMIPLSETVTSIGLVLPLKTFKQRTSNMDEFFIEHLRDFSVPLSQRVQNIKALGTARAIANYSFSIPEYAQDGLFCVGDSHRFIDPIFSFGVQFAVNEAEYVAQAIQDCANKPSEAWLDIHQSYMQITTQAQDVIQDLLAYFWKYPWGFANMAHQGHSSEFLEIFAGRIYGKEAGEGLTHMRKVLRNAK